MDMEIESESRSVLSDSLRPHELYSPWNSPGQITGVWSLSLFQGIFPTQGSNSGLLHCRWILYQLSHKGSPAGTGFDSKCDFIPLTIILGLLLCPWMCGIFFLVGSSIVLSMVVQQQVINLEFSQQKMSGYLSILPKETADHDHSHEIKRCLLLGRKAMTKIDSILKSRYITMPMKVCLVIGMVFPLVMYGCESWTIKKSEHPRINVFELCCWRRLLRVP